MQHERKPNMYIVRKFLSCVRFNGKFVTYAFIQDRNSEITYTHRFHRC